MSYTDEIQPVSIDQFIRGKDGRMILVEADVGGVVENLRRINENFRVRWSEAGNWYVVYHLNPDTQEEELVTTAQELDGRIVKRVEKIASDRYDYLAEIERLDKAADKAKAEKFREHIEDKGEILAHALRKDLGSWKDSARSKKSWGKE